ncbi:MAG: hypothetical protein WBQ11_11190, partial [Isosphaeraceae bacterium]
QKPSLGLATLLEVAGLAEKRKIDAEDVGFTLGPRPRMRMMRPGPMRAGPMPPVEASIARSALRG